ncbi:hypothetical protein [Nonomuraea sp. NPDC049646]|uniref:hypothetical protein n=1 Tax=unclassified Nonomuraea TaxID=2593643 RepID=UPI00379E5AE8
MDTTNPPAHATATHELPDELLAYATTFRIGPLTLQGRPRSGGWIITRRDGSQAWSPAGWVDLTGPRPAMNEHLAATVWPTRDAALAQVLLLLPDPPAARVLDGGALEAAELTARADRLLDVLQLALLLGDFDDETVLLTWMNTLLWNVGAVLDRTHARAMARAADRDIPAFGRMAEATADAAELCGSLAGLVTAAAAHASEGRLHLLTPPAVPGTAGGAT